MILSGRDIQWYIQQGKLVIDPVTPEQFQQNGIDLILEDISDRPSHFEIAQFYLGCTRETLRMPDDLMAFVELRSTWARSGLIIPPTIVDAGFIGNLTLEIVSYRKSLVPYGQRFAHVVFAKMTNPSQPYRGKYNGQEGITEAREEVRHG